MTGVFLENYTGDGFSVLVRRYAHRELTRLLVTEIQVSRTTCLSPIIVSLKMKTGPASKDVTLNATLEGG